MPNRLFFRAAKLLTIQWESAFDVILQAGNGTHKRIPNIDALGVFLYVTSCHSLVLKLVVSLLYDCLMRKYPGNVPVRYSIERQKALPEIKRAE